MLDWALAPKNTGRLSAIPQQTDTKQVRKIRFLCAYVSRQVQEFAQKNLWISWSVFDLAIGETT